MNAPPLLGLGAFGFALVLTPLVRDLVGARGWFDLPDQGRKVHSRPVPRVGGVPILLAGGIAFALLALSKVTGDDAVVRVVPFAWKLAPAVLTIFVVGLVDDRIGLRPWQKLASQFVAASLACWAGVGFTSVAGYALPSWFAIPLTLLWLAACANAFNLIDGIDGLAAGVALIASLAMLAAGVMLRHSGLALVSAALAGALLGFLRFNFSPASIFLGDCGSLTIGFLLGCCAIVWSNESATFGGAMAPLLALSVPLLDTALAVIRRVLRRRPVFHPDRDHIHHRLLAQGLSPRRAVLVLWAASALAAAFSLAGCVAGDPWPAAIVTIYCLLASVGVQRLGYAELRAARHVVGPARLLRAASAEIRLGSLEEALARASTLDQCWDAIRCACRELGFARASMRAQGTVRDAWLQGPGPRAVIWTMRVPLAAGDWVNIGEGFASAVEPSVIAPLADLLRRAIGPKLAPAGSERTAAAPEGVPALDPPHIAVVTIPMASR
jgi:UDP-GlcNAc:undecaprenyl-phosphate GlcNAc-1-phosphate transferase